mgnify:CR=1 FL=1
MLISFYKNGSEFKRTTYGSPSTFNQTAGSALIYCNGTTDYVELYGYVNASSGPAFQYGSVYTYMNGVLVKAA